MSKLLAATTLLALAGLDYAALDDITTGSQPGFAGEWTMLILSLPIAWLVTRGFRNAHKVVPSSYSVALPAKPSSGHEKQ